MGVFDRQYAVETAGRGEQHAYLDPRPSPRRPRSPLPGRHRAVAMSRTPGATALFWSPGDRARRNGSPVTTVEASAAFGSRGVLDRRRLDQARRDRGRRPSDGPVNIRGHSARRAKPRARRPEWIRWTMSTARSGTNAHRDQGGHGGVHGVPSTVVDRGVQQRDRQRLQHDRLHVGGRWLENTPAPAADTMAA